MCVVWVLLILNVALINFIEGKPEHSQDGEHKCLQCSLNKSRLQHYKWCFITRYGFVAHEDLYLLMTVYNQALMVEGLGHLGT